MVFLRTSFIIIQMGSFLISFPAFIRPTTVALGLFLISLLLFSSSPSRLLLASMFWHFMVFIWHFWHFLLSLSPFSFPIITSHIITFPGLSPRFYSHSYFQARTWHVGLDINVDIFFCLTMHKVAETGQTSTGTKNRGWETETRGKCIHPQHNNACRVPKKEACLFFFSRSIA